MGVRDSAGAAALQEGEARQLTLTLTLTLTLALTPTLLASQFSFILPLIFYSKYIDAATWGYRFRLMTLLIMSAPLQLAVIAALHRWPGSRVDSHLDPNPNPNRGPNPTPKPKPSPNPNPNPNLT